MPVSLLSATLAIDPTIRMLVIILLVLAIVGYFTPAFSGQRVYIGPIGLVLLVILLFLFFR